MGFFSKLFGGSSGHDLDELARRLGVISAELNALSPRYASFTIPKRSGGQRTILAPAPELKAMQRRILRRVLALLVAHPTAVGFERGKSIVQNAKLHSGKAVVIRMDLKDFFSAIREKRVGKFFEKIGWNRQAAAKLVELCTHKGVLPQGAPTSPRLSNLLNYRLDARLAGVARRFNAAYTRYADDLTFSFAQDDRRSVQSLINLVKFIVEEEGYQLHMKRKLHIRRQHDQQRVTGLVVNQKVDLTRETRRRLRAIEHHLATRGKATLTRSQLDGWRSLQSMIAAQR